MLDRHRLATLVAAAPAWLQANPDFAAFVAEIERHLPHDPASATTDAAAHAHPQVATADGSCLGNPGRGGWAVVFADGREHSGSIDGTTTNQRAEITAAINAIANATVGAPLTIRTDSRYVVETMNSGWARRSNHDLWNELDATVARHGTAVTFEWLRGHNGDAHNERADRLARAAANRAA